jgi:hypothetical protein
MKRPLSRSYLNGRVRPWTMKHRLSDLMRVLRRSVELATESGRSWAELWSAILDPQETFGPRTQTVDFRTMNRTLVNIGR